MINLTVTAEQLQFLNAAVLEYKHVLLESNKKPSERTPPTARRKSFIAIGEGLQEDIEALRLKHNC